MAEQQNTGDMLLRLLDDPEVQAAGQEQNADSDVPTGAEGMLGALPPDMLSKLPVLMSALGPMMGGKPGGGGVKDDKTALLLALKPYMSPQRCDAIDKLIMFNRLGEIMRQLR